MVAAKKSKKENLSFVIDCNKPVNDGVFDIAAYEKFLHDKFKVNGKAGNLQGLVEISRKQDKVVVNGTTHFSKRYLKYLTKKFLKKNLLRDWLHVIASDKQTYEIKYFNINQEEEAAEAA